MTHRGFTYDSVMSGFRDVEAQDYTLIAKDMRSLTFCLPQMLASYQYCLLADFSLLHTVLIG